LHEKEEGVTIKESYTEGDNMQNKETRHVLLRVLFVQLQLSFSHLNAFIHKSVLPTDMLKKIKSTIITRTITAMKKMYFLCIFVYFLSSVMSHKIF